MNELAMNLATGRVDYGYLKVLIVGKALFEKVPCEDAAMCNRVGIRLEFGSDPISERNTVYHIKEKFLHRPAILFFRCLSEARLLGRVSPSGLCNLSPSGNIVGGAGQ
jgi:hypothetical protein